MARIDKATKPNPDDPKSFRYKISNGFGPIGKFQDGDVCEWYEVAQDLSGLKYLLTVGAVEATEDKRNVGVGANAPTSELKDEIGKLNSEIIEARKVAKETQEELDAINDELEELRGNAENVEWLETKLAELKTDTTKDTKEPD